ncbi:MAG: Stk1 family PASTA domain-containing Ser/Thr kinase [Oscillospiraceae bacterium]|nr:Stk1 family PASTA domain-containing Ser/Thr kinase [Oscillospiraceae bacterium]
MDSHIDSSMEKYIGKLLDERYELLEVIGAGGMSIVYKALCHRLNRYVAVKLIRDEVPEDSEERKRFQAESQAVAMLSHPNIVAVYDVGRSEGNEYIVMELIEGVTLKDYMKMRGALSDKEVLHFSTQILKALSHAHGKGIVHRDIKPHNIMLLEDGTIKVADFGIACLLSDDGDNSGETIGSVHYASPEQARGGAADSRSDIYSAGVVLYEMLTGELPYEGDSPEEIALQHLSAMPKKLTDHNPDIPEQLEVITLKAMNANIDMRYQSADEMLADLEEYRKQRSQIAAAPEAESGADHAEELEETQKEDYYVVKWDVAPIARSGEMTEENYRRRVSRSRKVSMLSGFFGVLVFLVVMFIVLWQYWLRGLFEDPVRVEMPNFVGEDIERIEDDPAYEDFKFVVETVIDPNNETGTILKQNPEAGRHVTKSPDKIRVDLTVSSGLVMVEMPDVVNKDYRQAIIELEKLGFKVEYEIVADPSITKDYVVSTFPEAQEELMVGSTVYLKVSGGPEIKTVTVPVLVGYYEATALNRIESANLTVGGINYVYNDDYNAGVVCWQNINANMQVEERYKIYINVSKGPKETPKPTPEATEPDTPPEATNEE